MSFRHFMLVLCAAFLLTPSCFAQAHTVSGQEVLKLTQQYVDVAPKRYIGSPGYDAAEAFIKAHFGPEVAKGNFVDDRFVARTPIGPLTMHNLIVKFPGKKDGIIVLASHYETNYWLKDIHFIGANDGACTTALLIALGQYYREHPPQGYSIWLLFTDGEETINKETNSTPWLLDLLAKAGRGTGNSKYLFKESQPIEDDHLPFQERGVPVLDVIDYVYGTSSNPEAFHHTEEDTMDKLSATSLQVSADLFLDLVKLINQR